MVSPYCLQIILLRLLGVIQIPPQLEIHPEISGHSEEFRQAQGRAGGDAAVTIDNFIDALIRHMDRFRQFALSQPHRSQKLFQEHFTRMGWGTVSGYPNHRHLSKSKTLMVIHDLDPVWTRIRPDETNPILVINPQAMLPFTVTAQDLQPVSRWNFEFTKGRDRIQLIKFPSGYFPQRFRADLPRRFRIPAIENVYGAGIAERPDHANRIAWNPCYFK